MYLQSAQIYNFRGIRHSYIDFQSDTTVLIGENSWGKSSLLRALWMLLGQGEILCSFEKHDLYIPLNLSSCNKTNPYSDIECFDSLVSHQDTNKNNYNIQDQSLLASEQEKTNSFDSFLQFYKTSHNFEQDPSHYYQQNYEFLAHDIFNDDINKIFINLKFKESALGAIDKSVRLQRLSDAWQLEDDGFHSINWRVIAFENEDGVFVTKHHLVDAKNNIINCDHEKLIKILISMNPLLRIRDSRMSNAVAESTVSSEDNAIESAKKIYELNEDDNVTAYDIKESIDTLNTITSKYLTGYANHGLLKRNCSRPRTIKDIINKPLSVESLSSLKQSLQQKGITRAKILLSYLASALMLNQQGRTIDKRSRPILVLEDIEGRFHPSLLSSLLSLLDTLPAQKLITTNSGELLSSISLESIRRICRQFYDTRCYKVNEGNLNYDDLRRITFHIRINRPSTLFARCWFLVEGETEVWIMTEIARILGIGLHAEGIRVVEFAQCGLSSLLKFARSLGISFYVLTDGDEAGSKYANTVRELIGKKHARKHLTVLPSLDIEHFFFNNGYDNIILREAKVNSAQRKSLTIDKIITYAIKHKTKPGLALSIVEEIQKRGVNGVPKLLQQMYQRIRVLVKSEFGID